MSENSKPARRLSNKAAIRLILLAVAGIGVVIGMSFPLVTLSLERMQFGATVIGLNSATGSLGILVVGLLSSRLLARYNATFMIITASILSVLSLLLLPVSGIAAGWFVLRFILALGIGFLWLICETWLNAVADSSNRGRIIGIYGAAFSGGFALGPLIVSLTGAQGWLPFAIAAAIMAVSCLPMVLLGDLQDDIEEEQIGQLHVLRLFPFIFFVAFAAGLFETTAYALLPVYTLGEGLGESGSMYALSAFAAGGIAFQYPMGKLADSAGRNALLMVTTLGVLFGVIAIPFVIDAPELLLVVLFFLGGSVFGLYTLGLILLGDGFGVKNLVTANAMFIILYEAGAVVGPALSGAAMEVWPDWGFVGFLLLSAVLFAAAALFKPKAAHT
jgi:MFS family permease